MEFPNIGRTTSDFQDVPTDSQVLKDMTQDIDETSMIQNLVRSAGINNPGPLSASIAAWLKEHPLCKECNLEKYVSFGQMFWISCVEHFMPLQRVKVSTLERIEQIVAGKAPPISTLVEPSPGTSQGIKRKLDPEVHCEQSKDSAQELINSEWALRGGKVFRSLTDEQRLKMVNLVTNEILQITKVQLTPDFAVLSGTTTVHAPIIYYVYTHRASLTNEVLSHSKSTIKSALTTAMSKKMRKGC